MHGNLRTFVSLDRVLILEGTSQPFCSIDLGKFWHILTNISNNKPIVLSFLSFYRNVIDKFIMAPRKHSRPRSKSAPAVLRTPTKKIKRKQWSNDAMVSAMEEAERGMPVKRAARLFGVPRSTLRDRVAGNVKH